MRVALPASVAIHLGLLAAAYAFLNWPDADDTALESVSIDIVSMEEFTSNAVSEAVSVATKNMVAAGAEAVEGEEIEPVEKEVAELVEPVTETVEEELTETLEPVETELAEAKTEEPVEPVRTASVEPVNVPMEAAPVEVTAAGSLPVLSATVTSATPVEGLMTEIVVASPEVELAPSTASQAEPLEAVEDAPTAPERVTELDPAFDPSKPVTAVPAEPIESAVPVHPKTIAMVEATTTEMLAPTEVTEFEAAPVPKTRTVQQKTEPTFPEEPKKKKKAAEEQPTKKDAPEEQPKKKRAASAPGSGGQNEADSAAAPQSGGEGASDVAGNAAVSKYPGQVQAKLRRALRFPKNADGSGEVHVAFVIAANGQASQISIVRSSGDPVLDEAAIATVKRAAPFPPIPAAAGRSSWSFAMPLAFQR